MKLQVVQPIWAGQTCIVCAPGPSLSPNVSELCRESRFATIAVQDAWRRVPWAPVLYGCDAKWWNFHKGVPEFQGEKWSSHGSHTSNDKQAVGARYGITLVQGRQGYEFSADPSHICYGGNSGFQAINLAILFGGRRIVLVGFDMHGTHFFGKHPAPLHNVDPRRFIPAFVRAARKLPAGVEIINATAGTALRCFPRMSLEDALGAQITVEAA